MEDEEAKLCIYLRKLFNLYLLLAGTLQDHRLTRIRAFYGSPDPQNVPFPTSRVPGDPQDIPGIFLRLFATGRQDSTHRPVGWLRHEPSGYQD